MAKPVPRLTPVQIAQVTALAWEDQPPFTAVLLRHGLSEGQLVQLLKRELTPTAYRLWARRLHSSGGAAPAPRKAARRSGAKVRSALPK